MRLNNDKNLNESNGVIFPYRRFMVSFQRTKMLLTVGLDGLNQKLQDFSSLLDKIAKTKVEEPETIKAKVVEKNSEDLTSISLSDQDVEIIERAIKYTHTEHSVLDTYLYSILHVFIWGAFETYFSMLFSELFKMKPQMLISSETLTYKDLIDSIDNPIELIIGRELNKIGHFKIKEMIKYLKDKLNICLDQDEEKKLVEIYLIRNIIAHNTGIIRGDMVSSMPENVMIVDNEIKLSKDFLEDTLDILKNIVDKIHAKVVKKFNNTKTAEEEVAVSKDV